MAALTILESSQGLRTVECTPLKVILPITSENRAILWFSWRFLGSGGQTNKNWMPS